MASSRPFHVVGVGASAGGLEALSALLRGLDPKLPCAYIIAQHLSPTYKSMMVDLLSRETKLTVQAARHGQRIQAGHIYVTPPDRDILLEGEMIELRSASLGVGPKPSVDIFLTALAESLKERAIGVILSGTGSDGSRGVRAIKAEGGIAIIQEPGSAKYDGMPLSAIQTGLADRVLTPDEMAAELAHMIHFPESVALSHQASKSGDEIATILGHVLRVRGVDFSQYKRTTILRRIERRMAALRLMTLKEYAERTATDVDEVHNLAKDILIGVTSFFRDPEAFEALAKHLGQRLKRSSDPIRIWVPGCSTGEEAYSIAILLSETLGDGLQAGRVQIFGTDLDEGAAQIARMGRYPESSLINLDPERIERFFIKKAGSFEVVKSIRDMVIFSVHDLLKDPPFLRPDLISCRNLLIYFDTVLQQQVFPLFHYALRPGGLLFLGKSESVGSFENLFGTLEKSARVFWAYEGVQSRLSGIGRYIRTAQAHPKEAALPRSKGQSVREATQEALSEVAFPYYMSLGESDEVLYFHGGQNPYIFIARSGEATLNIYKIIHADLNLELRALMHRVRRERTRVSSRLMRVRLKGGDRYVQMIATPIQHDVQSCWVLLGFNELEPGLLDEAFPQAREANRSDQRVQELEHELFSNREHLQTVIEELETSNEEMQSLNEELQSTNEELQSTNEELETTNEELQSANEELQSAYSELRIAYEERTASQKRAEEQNRELKALHAQLEEEKRTLKERVEQEVKHRMADERTASAIFETAGVGLCVTDEKGRFERVNHRYLEIYGYSEEELIGQDFIKKLIPKADQARVRKLYRDYLAGRVEEIGQEWLLARKDGTPLHLFVEPSRIEIDGRICKITSIADITELKRLIEKSWLQEERLMEQSRFATMGEMIGAIAHQWRQPLNAIGLFVQSLQYDYDKGVLDRQLLKERIDGTMEQVFFMSRTIDDFRDYFKPTTEGGAINLLEAVKSAVHLMSAQMKNHQIEVEIKEPDRAIWAHGSINHLKQCVINILTNAQDAILESPQADSGVIGRVEIAIRSLKTRAEIVLFNTAPAPDQAVRDRMFEPYFTTKEEGSGTGIGLYMTRTILERHFQGGITTRVRPDGFEFTIWVPIGQEGKESE